MKKYPWLMKRGRRDLLLLVIFLTVGVGLSAVLVWSNGVVHPTEWIDRAIMSPIGAFYLAFCVIYFLKEFVLPLGWYIDEHGVRTIQYPSGRIEPCFEDWIKQPKVRKGLGLDREKAKNGIL